MARRRRTNVFLWAVLFISFAAGITQHDLWPFSSWPVLAHTLPSGWNYSPPPDINGVDSSGNEYDVDYRAWQPLALEELTSWIRLHFAHLDPAERDRAGAYLLGRGEQALSQRKRNSSSGSWLGTSVPHGRCFMGRKSVSSPLQIWCWASPAPPSSEAWDAR